MVEIAIKPVCVGVSIGGLSRCEADDALFGDEWAMAAVSGQVAEAVSRNPLAYLSDTDAEIAAVWQQKFDEYSCSSMPPVALSISYKWQEADAAIMATGLRGANPKKKGAFLDFARHSGDIQFVGAVMTTTSHDAKGASMAGQMLADLKDPKLGAEILYSIPNPARGARILNYWEHYAGSGDGVVEIEKDFLKPMGPELKAREDEPRYRRRMLLAYRIGATVDSDESDVGGREKVLKVFDDYELSRDQAALQKRIAELRSEKILRDCRVLDFKGEPDGRVENLECHFAKDEFAERVKAIRREISLSTDRFANKAWSKEFADRLAKVLAARGIPSDIRGWHDYKAWTDAADRVAKDILADKATLQRLCKGEPVEEGCGWGEVDFRGIKLGLNTVEGRRSVDVGQRIGDKEYIFNSESETYAGEINLKTAARSEISGNSSDVELAFNFAAYESELMLSGARYFVSPPHGDSPLDEDMSAYFERLKAVHQEAFDCQKKEHPLDFRCLDNYFRGLNKENNNSGTEASDE